MDAHDPQASTDALETFIAAMLRCAETAGPVLHHMTRHRAGQPDRKAAGTQPPVAEVLGEILRPVLAVEVGGWPPVDLEQVATVLNSACETMERELLLVPAPPLSRRAAGRRRRPRRRP